VTDTVMVTQDVGGDRMIRFGDGRGTAGTMTVRDDRMYAHIPLVLHPAPRDVLSICFGVGNSLAAILVHPVAHVDAVELSPGVVDAAPLFRKTNRDVLTDPRVRLTIADGRNFLLASHDAYDVIRLDPPELHTAGVVNLYTREFYELARAHLRPGGIFSIWVNIVMTRSPICASSCARWRPSSRT
jgi:spermidine synthase